MSGIILDNVETPLHIDDNGSKSVKVSLDGSTDTEKLLINSLMHIASVQEEILNQLKLINLQLIEGIETGLTEDDIS